MAKFFPGRRSLKPIELFWNKFKTHFKCEIYAYWKDIDYTSISCGSKANFTLRRRVGIDKKEYSTIGSLIQGSLGIKGLAEIKSEIQEKSGIEVSWHEYEESEKSISFKAPELGRRSDYIYQLVREYVINFSDRRLFQNERWQNVITEYTHYHHQQHLIQKYDPECEGADKSRFAGEIYDGNLEIDMGNVSMLVPFKTSESAIEIFLDDKSFKITGRELAENRFELNKEGMPESLFFLSGSSSAKFPSQIYQITNLNLIPEAMDRSTNLFENIIDHAAKMKIDLSAEIKMDYFLHYKMAELEPAWCETVPKKLDPFDRWKDDLMEGPMKGPLGGPIGGDMGGGGMGSGGF
jgi:hypothetical protein